MEFLRGFLWGTGVSLGLCVGLVVWIFLRTWAHWIVGISDELRFRKEHDRKCLAALEERNQLSGQQIDVLRDIAFTISQSGS